MKKYFILFILLSITSVSFAQNFYIYTREGKQILIRRDIIRNCLNSFHKDFNDPAAVAICECQVNKLDKHFTKKQYRQFTDDRMIDLNGLIKSDSEFHKQYQECYTASGKTLLLEAEGFESDFITECVRDIQRNTEKKLDTNKLNKFCKCQLEMVKEKKITDEQMKALSNPNSLLFYEIMYTCGNPFEENDKYEKCWNETSIKDIDGPETDTINILTMNGMTYLKLKTGSLIQFWLLDTGASDLLINKDMESTLKNEHIITEDNYLGIGEYEMANGMIDTCRKYLVNNISIGKYKLNNIVVAVTDKGKRIIVGKILLNKFSNWILDNKENLLILHK